MRSSGTCRPAAPSGETPREPSLEGAVFGPSPGPETVRWARRPGKDGLVCPALFLGQAARRALGSDSGWRVLAVFRRSVYCVSAREAMVCLGPLCLGAGPLNILAALTRNPNWEDWGVVPGAAVAWDGAALRLSARLAISLAKVRLWQPASPPSHWDPAVLLRNLEELAAEVRHLAVTDGLAPWIPSLLTGSAYPRRSAAPSQGLIQAVEPGVAALRAWLESGLSSGATHDDPPAAVEGLIGLGPGLTPSGDDLLGGTLIALRALGWPTVAGRLAHWLLQRARARTHAISYAHLACAAEGQGASALHGTLVAICTSGGPGIRPHLKTLGSIGHSSGWDALAGLVLVIEIASNARLPRASGPIGGTSRMMARCPAQNAYGARHVDEG